LDIPVGVGVGGPRYERIKASHGRRLRPALQSRGRD